MKTLYIVGAVLITLKLIGALSWTWWLVLLPIYGAFGVQLTWIALFVWLMPTRHAHRPRPF